MSGAEIWAEELATALDKCLSIIRMHVKPGKCVSRDNMVTVFSAQDAHNEGVEALQRYQEAAPTPAASALVEAVKARCAAVARAHEAAVLKGDLRAAYNAGAGDAANKIDALDLSDLTGGDESG